MRRHIVAGIRQWLRNRNVYTWDWHSNIITGFWCSTLCVFASSMIEKAIVLVTSLVRLKTCIVHRHRKIFAIRSARKFVARRGIVDVLGIEKCGAILFAFGYMQCPARFRKKKGKKKKKKRDRNQKYTTLFTFA
jgi:hypothetical protein